MIKYVSDFCCRTDPDPVVLELWSPSPKAPLRCIRIRAVREKDPVGADGDPLRSVTPCRMRPLSYRPGFWDTITPI